ncbi:MAG: glycosyltransferase [Armatimonadetes bacterium]|nr:glycosyltransferase [Armatimonadota bacterium]
MLTRCAAVVPASERLAARYLPLHPRVQSVGNFPDLSLLEVGRRVQRKQQRCVYAGTLGPNRGIECLIRAIGVLRDQGTPVPLDLVGGFVSRGFGETVLRLVGDLDLGVLVRLHGVVERSVAITIQCAASIAVVPDPPVGNNLFGVSTKMLECMALGLPIVYSTVPSHAEVGDVWHVGVGVDPEQPASVAAGIRRLMDDRQLAASSGANGRDAVVSQFNWQNEAGKLLTLYDEILRK